MNSDSENETFLERSPLISKNQVNKQGKKWRDGEPYDEEVIDSFLAFNADLLEELLEISRSTISSFILSLKADENHSVQPNSDSYTLTARVKTRDTLVEKMRRMGETPLARFQDVAGIRFDCDLTLAQQILAAEAFAQDFRNSGAERVDVKDYRDAPHSGYRAVHLHIQSKAGRAEMQIRTALQSKWANLYEEAADILGRDIRYLHEGAKMPRGADELVKRLHHASGLVQQLEELSEDDAASKKSDIEALRKETYGTLDSIHSSLKLLRKKPNDSKGEPNDIVFD